MKCISQQVKSDSRQIQFSFWQFIGGVRRDLIFRQNDSVLLSTMCSLLHFSLNSGFFDIFEPIP